MAHVIKRRLVFDYQQYLQQPFHTACSHLKKNCDQIFQSAVSLSLQRLGIPHPSIISVLDIIQRVSHTFRIAYRYSNLAYGRYTIPDEFRHFIMVLCQENFCTPQIRSIISSIVFSALLTQGFGIHLGVYEKIKSFLIFS